MDKPLPWMKLYTTDWRADTALRLCTFECRGLCIDAMTLMHEATPYGHLLINGRIPTMRQLAALLGAKNARQIETLMRELLDAGVFVKKADGTIFSPRMVRENEKATEGRSSANKRWDRERKSGKQMRRPNSPPIGEPIAQMPESRIQKPDLSSSLRSDDGGEASDLPKAVADWNALAAEIDLPSVQRLTEARRAKLRARLKECGGIEGWSTALGKLKRIAWMRGSNNRNWRASFDFVIEEANFTKLMEGVYDEPARRFSAGRGKSSNDFADIIAEECPEDPADNPL